MKSIRKHILIVEDDKGLREGISLALRRDDYLFTLCGEIKEADKARLETEFDLVILDINLPDGNGYDYLVQLKNESAVPVIIITANDLEIDEVRGLELGADDYITKPFGLMALRARIEKILQHGRINRKKEYRFGNLRFYFEEMRFFIGEREIELSKTESRLLQVLVENSGIIITRERLIELIWSDGAEFVEENALSVTVNRLRGKLEEDSTAPKYLITAYGKGYMWKKEARQ